MLASPSVKGFAEDVDEESRKVRSMYEATSGLDWIDGVFTSIDNRLKDEEERTVETPES
jgi:hypothetical protein